MAKTAVKKSPNKLQKQKSFTSMQVFIKDNAVLIVSILTVLLFVVLSTAVYYRYKYVTVAVNADDYYAYQAWQPNDIVESRDIAFSFNGVRTDTTSIPGFWVLNSGEKYVIVDVSFKNKTKSDYQLSPVMSMKLIDDSGVEYGVTSAPAIANGLGGAVAPGVTVRGDVGFTVPESANKLSFRFEPYVASSAPITVNFDIKVKSGGN